MAQLRLGIPSRFRQAAARYTRNHWLSALIYSDEQLIHLVGTEKPDDIVCIDDANQIGRHVTASRVPSHQACPFIGSLTSPSIGKKPAIRDGLKSGRKRRTAYGES
jgi:hypothetical protein